MIGCVRKFVQCWFYVRYRFGLNFEQAAQEHFLIRGIEKLCLQRIGKGDRKVCINTMFTCIICVNENTALSFIYKKKCVLQNVPHLTNSRRTAFYFIDQDPRCNMNVWLSSETIFGICAVSIVRVTLRKAYDLQTVTG